MSIVAGEAKKILYYSEGPRAPEVIGANERALRKVTNGARYSIETALGNPERTFLDKDISGYHAIVVDASSVNVDDVVAALQMARESGKYQGEVIFVYSESIPAGIRDVNATRIKTKAGDYLDRDAALEIARTLGLVSREGRA